MKKQKHHARLLGCADEGASLAPAKSNGRCAGAGVCVRAMRADDGVGGRVLA